LATLTAGTLGACRKITDPAAAGIRALCSRPGKVSTPSRPESGTSPSVQSATEGGAAAPRPWSLAVLNQADRATTVERATQFGHSVTAPSGHGSESGAVSSRSIRPLGGVVLRAGPRLAVVTTVCKCACVTNQVFFLRRFSTQPGLFTWRPRPTASAPPGTASVITLPAAI